MSTRIALWTVIGLMFVVALFLTFKAGAGSIEIGQVVATAAKSAAASSGMVGGC